MKRALFAVGLAACYRDPSPTAVLDRYATLVHQGHVEAAYMLTSARYRAHHDLAAFAAQLAREPLVLSPTRRLDTELVVTVHGADGAATLVGDDAEHLVLTTDPLDAYPQDTPEATLRSLARAVTHDRREALTHLLAAPFYERLHMHAEEPLPDELVEAAHRIGERLAPVAGIAAPIVELDGEGRARLLLEEGIAVPLEQGSGIWRIVDLP